VIPALLFPGWVDAARERQLGDFVRRHPEAVGVMQAAVGASVVEIEWRGGRWRAVTDSPRNWRVTANTPMVFAGPAQSHPWLGGSVDRPGSCLGMIGNCAAGQTPWGTYLTAEENTDDFFGNGGAAELDAALATAHRRFGLRFRDSAFRWEYADRRFDTAVNPTEPMKFGWIVEIDPFDPAAPIKKRTALGRFKHESATTVLARDGRPVVYTGDDEVFEYLYKFVADGRFDPERPAANRDLLDRGRLHVARLAADGSGEWLPLVFGENPALSEAAGFSNQADVLVRCREAADRLGATPLDRPEDVAVHPETGYVYLSCTQNLERGTPEPRVSVREYERGVDAANPRAGNAAGHILELIEDGGDAAGTRFRWNVFVLAGDPSSGELRITPPRADEAASAATTYYGGQADAAALAAFANPDNLGFDADGNLWIVTDGTQPGDNNNGCFVCPTQGPERGAVRQFMCGPVGAEICGCQFTPDAQTLLLTIQHPGSGGSVERSISHWPDGGNALPRASLIAIRPGTPGRRFGT
jgi:hypothetical protein